MANQELNNSLHSQHFFKIILTDTIQNGSLELPSSFVKEHGNSLCNCVCLQVSNGALTWQVEVKRRDRRVWLHKGWQDFVEYYSIKCAYFLVFRYEGESRFHVFIFDTTTLEIQYPVPTQREVIEIKEEDGDDDDAECLVEINASKLKLKSYAKQSREVRRQHSGIAWDKVLQRGQAFNSPNPCFIIRIQQYHVSPKCCLYIPHYARSHFLEKENNGIYLNLDENGRSWFVKYFIDIPPQIRVRLSGSGWGIFMRENRLQVGDVCVFELLNSTTMVFKVAIFRIADYA